jgi:hypothetical protein
MDTKTLDEYIRAYGDPAAPWPVVEVGPQAEQWPAIVVKAGDKAAVVRFMNVAAEDPAAQHLCIDVHSFVAGRQARGSVFGMEQGHRFDGFPGAQVFGTSHGWPAASLVAVLVGAQQDAPR